MPISSPTAVDGIKANPGANITVYSVHEIRDCGSSRKASQVLDAPARCYCRALESQPRDVPGVTAMAPGTVRTTANGMKRYLMVYFVRLNRVLWTEKNCISAKDELFKRIYNILMV